MFFFCRSGPFEWRDTLTPFQLLAKYCALTGKELTLDKGKPEVIIIDETPEFPGNGKFLFFSPKLHCWCQVRAASLQYFLILLFIFVRDMSRNAGNDENGEYDDISPKAKMQANELRDKGTNKAANLTNMAKLTIFHQRPKYKRISLRQRYQQNGEFNEYGEFAGLRVFSLFSFIWQFDKISPNSSDSPKL